MHQVMLKRDFKEECGTEFLLTNVKDQAVRLICGAVAKRHSVERHFTTTQETFSGLIHRVHYWGKKKLAGSKKKLQAATEASFWVANFWTKHKKIFWDVKGAMTVIANSLFKDHKSGNEIMSTLSDVQLAENTKTRRAIAVSERNGAAGERLGFLRMVLHPVWRVCGAAYGFHQNGFQWKRNFWHEFPFKTTTRSVDVYNEVKKYLMDKNVPFEKLVTTDDYWIFPSYITSLGNWIIWTVNCKAYVRQSVTWSVL